MKHLAAFCLGLAMAASAHIKGGSLNVKIGLHQQGGFLEARFPSSGHASLEVLGLNGTRQRTLELASGTTGNVKFRVSLKELGIVGRSVVRLRWEGNVVAESLVGRLD